MSRAKEKTYKISCFSELRKGTIDEIAVVDDLLGESCDLVTAKAFLIHLVMRCALSNKPTEKYEKGIVLCSWGLLRGYTSEDMGDDYAIERRRQKFIKETGYKGIEGYGISIRDDEDLNRRRNNLLKHEDRLYKVLFDFFSNDLAKENMDDFIDEAIKAETSSGRVKYPDMVTLTGANGRIKSNEDINSKSLNRMATKIDKENAAQKGGVTTQHKSKIIAGILIAITIVLFLVLGLITSGLHAGTITSTIQQTIDGSDVQAKLKRDLAELKVRYTKRDALEKAANEGDAEAQFGLWNDYYLEHDYDQASYDICPAGWHMPSTTDSNNVAGS